jgi:hypothetical protein
MKKDDIIENAIVIDRWYLNYGKGKIVNIKKTVFDVQFPEKTITYDFPHAKFLEKIDG